MYESLSYQCKRPWDTSVWYLETLLYEDLRYKCMSPWDTSVCGDNISHSQLTHAQHSCLVHSLLPLVAQTRKKAKRFVTKIFEFNKRRRIKKERDSPKKLKKKKGTNAHSWFVWCFRSLGTPFASFGFLGRKNGRERGKERKTVRGRKTTWTVCLTFFWFVLHRREHMWS